MIVAVAWPYKEFFYTLMSTWKHWYHECRRLHKRTAFLVSALRLSESIFIDIISCFAWCCCSTRVLRYGWSAETNVINGVYWIINYVNDCGYGFCLIENEFWAGMSERNIMFFCLLPLLAKSPKALYSFSDSESRSLIFRIPLRMLYTKRIWKYLAGTSPRTFWFSLPHTHMEISLVVTVLLSGQFEVETGISSSTATFTQSDRLSTTCRAIFQLSEDFSGLPFLFPLNVTYSTVWK